MASGYEILAEAFMREQRYDDAFKAAKMLPDTEPSKELIIREIRNNSVKFGNLERYQEASELIGLEKKNPGDLATIFLVNLDSLNLNEMLRIIEILPNGDEKQQLLDTAITEAAHKGAVAVCERLAKARGRDLTNNELEILRTRCVREGWISDAERAAAIAGIELTREEYTIMVVANKDKGLLNETSIAAGRAGRELNEAILTSLMLAAVRFGRDASAWEIAKILSK